MPTPDLTTKTKRKRLPKGKKFHWQRVAKGRAVGYRRGSGAAGTWYARAFVGDGTGSPYRTQALGPADDKAEADGVSVLTYAQAVSAATKWNPLEKSAGEPATVQDAVTRYLDYLAKHRRSGDHVAYSMNAHVLPELGDVLLDHLTADKLKAWHEALAEKPARLRTRPGAKRRNTRKTATEDQQRSRKATANRVLSQFKAALNMAWHDGLTESKPWERVKAFPGVDKARTRFLEQDELQRLVNAAEPDFRNLILAAIYTGCRFGELAALEAQDVSTDARAVHVAKSKTGHPRHVYLNGEGLEFFERLAAGKKPGELLLTRADGEHWKQNHQQRRIAETCKAGNIEPRLRFHELRHTYASLYLMAGGGLPDLAKQLGHTTTRMVEKHYGHLADHYRAKQAEEFAPSLGIKAGKLRKFKTAR